MAGKADPPYAWSRKQDFVAGISQDHTKNTAAQGKNLFPFEVGLEWASRKVPRYERDLAKIAVLRLAFAEGVEYEQEHLVHALSGLSFTEPISLEILATEEEITYQAVCQRSQVRVLTDRLSASLPGLVVQELHPKTEPLYSFLDTWRRRPRDDRPHFRFADFYQPICFGPAFERSNLENAAGSLLACLAALRGQSGALAGIQLLLVPVKKFWHLAFDTPEQRRRHGQPFLDLLTFLWAPEAAYALGFPGCERVSRALQNGRAARADSSAGNSPPAGGPSPEPPA